MTQPTLNAVPSELCSGRSPEASATGPLKPPPLLVGGDEDKRDSGVDDEHEDDFRENDPSTAHAWDGIDSAV
jgi:hypothetical protein